MVFEVGLVSEELNHLGVRRSVPDGLQFLPCITERCWGHLNIGAIAVVCVAFRMLAIVHIANVSGSQTSARVAAGVNLFVLKLNGILCL